MKSIESPESASQYEALRLKLEAFLSLVGERVLQYRREAEKDPDFARLKADRSIVTKADELAEDLIRAWIIEQFPGDTIRGEEREQKKGGSRMWVVDPIDGTYNFTHFGNKFGISVGLIEDNTPKLGVIWYPAENISLSSSEGAGTKMNGEQIVVPEGKRHLKDAMMFAALPKDAKDERFQESSKQLVKLFEVTSHRDIRMSFTFDFLDFLKGDEDALFHFGATPYDIGAMYSLAKELNLSVSGFDGKQLDFSRDIIPIVISKNPEIHREIIERLNS